MAPRFSIVIPTRDREDSLASTLAAISKLEAPPGGYEVVVVDDGGRRSLDGRVTGQAEGVELRIHRQANLGPAAARNAGARLARGEVLGFLDDDVRVSPEWLGAMDRAARRTPSAALGGRIDPGGASRTTEVSEQIVELATERRERPEAPHFLPSSNLVVPAHDFGEIGGFDPAFRISEDRELCRRWQASGRRLVYVADAVCEHVKDLTVGEFARQHFRYGGGAFAYQRGRPDGGSLAVVIDFSFYRRVLSAFASALARGQLARAGLIALWQLANTAGFGAAAARAYRGRRAPGSHGQIA
jgi:GT2 family glycosyltransferase